jgi:predicted DNA-binding transcriptional regulator YafY
VTQIIEVDDLVKRWIPSMRVLSPRELKEKILQDIKKFQTLIDID